jgi:diacylglycerol kinase (CTP)
VAAPFEPHNASAYSEELPLSEDTHQIAHDTGISTPARSHDTFDAAANEINSLPSLLLASLSRTKRCLFGLVPSPSLPNLPASWSTVMSSARYAQPRTPRVIPASPTPTESSSKDGYFGPMTRSISRAKRVSSPTPVHEDSDSPGSDPEKRARTRSRSPVLGSKLIAPLTEGSSSTTTPSKPSRRKNGPAETNGSANGHLEIPGKSRSWREISRSPSPLGLIPIHTQFRSFVGFFVHNVISDA